MRVEDHSMSMTDQKTQESLLEDSFRVHISEDKYSAYVEVRGELPLSPPSESEITAFLGRQGVTFGIESDLKSKLGSLQPGMERIQIARGCIPVDGKDGWIEFLFDHSPKVPVNDEEKHVDYHNLGCIHNVLKNEALAIIHPPEPGLPGTTVGGKKVPPKLGKQPAISLGSNTARNPIDPNQIIATQDGNATLTSGSVLNVQPVITISGSVDYSTGDIDFVGSVVISGDVKADFSVKAKKGIEVKGNVEDARLESGADVIIRGGFIGQGKGTLTAEGNVHIHHVLNQSVNSGGIITIDQEAISARLSARDKIVGRNAVFVGGILEARNEVEVKNLGNGDEGQARVRVGSRKIYLDRLRELENETAHAQKQMGEVKATIYKLVMLQLDKGTLTPEQTQLHAKLKGAQTELQNKLDRNQKEKESLNVELQKRTTARILIHDTIFPNVIVDLNGCKKIIDSAIREVLMTEHDGKVEEQALE
jgi:uncharacterized protein (DUF342 family)